MAQVGVDRRHRHRAGGQLEQAAVRDHAAHRHLIADGNHAHVTGKVHGIGESQRAGVRAQCAQRHRALNHNRLGHGAGRAIAGGHQGTILQHQRAAAILEILHET